MNNDEARFAGGLVEVAGNRAPVVHVPKGLNMAHADVLAAQERSLALVDPEVAQAVKTLQKARKTKMACLGIPSDILEKGSQEYARCVRLANAYKRARVRELYDAHGFVSSGVNALVASESLALSASRFLYAAAAESGTANPAIIKLAANLADSSRQSSLAAWELAAREGIVRRRNKDQRVDVPWMVTEENTKPGGEVKRPRGRPRKAAVVVVDAVLSEGEPNAG